MDGNHQVGKPQTNDMRVSKTEKCPAYCDVINPQVINVLKKKIIAIVVNQKKYRDKDYSAKQLAIDLGTNTRYVSATINIHFKMNYTSFINKCRIDEAMEVLKDEKYKDLRIEEVSDMVGFSNRQSFYTSFCKFTGVTPKAYKRANFIKD